MHVISLDCEVARIPGNPMAHDVMNTICADAGVHHHVRAGRMNTTTNTESAWKALGMQIDIWSDVVCPFCYVGKRKLELALTETGIRAAIEWHSFELDPTAPRSLGRSLPDLMAEKYRAGPDRALRLVEQQQHAAEEVGLEFNWSDARRGNTFDAHRLIHLGKAHGRADAVQERLMRGYFTEGAEIGNPGVLRRLAVEAGLEELEIAAVLAGDAFTEDVRADERRAGELGIHAVPHFLINGRAVISGAPTVPEFVDVLLGVRRLPAAPG